MSSRSLVTFALLVVASLSACARVDRMADSPVELRATEDPDVIERGRYLVYGPGHCVACHTPEGPNATSAPREMRPLVGGYAFRFPGGTVFTPNLTPDPETGIGRRTDAELVRVLRHGIRADGRKAFPIMAYQNLSDADLQAILSFLRAQPAVRHDVPDRRLNFAGRIGMKMFVRAQGPDGTPPPEGPAPGPTIERGAYLANTVAQCVGCHTTRSPINGSLKGPRFAGGLRMPVDDDPSVVLVTPNLTPDAETGIMAAWSEERFVARFRAGKVVAGSHMPWAEYGRMEEADLRAIYRYLQSLEPVRNETLPVVRRR